MSLEKTPFTEMLIAANGIDPNAFEQWAFCPGMLFASPDKWWGDHGRRDFPHEGIDFCLYKDSTGNLVRLAETTLIPAMHDGVVKAMFTDYLGQAVIVEHENFQCSHETYLSVYAHTKPRVDIAPGVSLKKGDIIGTLAGTGRSKAKILPHLHFSLGRPSPDLVYEPFVWDIMRDPDSVVLLNPMSVIDWPCQELDPDGPFCREI